MASRILIGRSCEGVCEMESLMSQSVANAPITTRISIAKMIQRGM